MDSRIGLSASRLLEAVDAGASGDAAARGRVLLAFALPAEPDGRLDALSLGNREAWLLALRRGTFGDTLGARVKCPACGLLLGVDIPASQVALQEPAVEEPATLRVECEGGVVVEARPPDGAALAAAAACGDVDEARAALIARCCVAAAGPDGAALPVEELDDAALATVGDALVAAEPQSEVRVELACAACATEWSPTLDLGLYLWREVKDLSVQLLDEVHELAMGYGWSEEETLRLPSRRRRQYVERLTRG